MTREEDIWINNPGILNRSGESNGVVVRSSRRAKVIEHLLLGLCVCGKRIERLLDCGRIAT